MMKISSITFCLLARTYSLGKTMIMWCKENFILKSLGSSSQIAMLRMIILSFLGKLRRHIKIISSWEERRPPFVQYRLCWSVRKCCFWLGNHWVVFLWTTFGTQTLHFLSALTLNATSIPLKQLLITSRCFYHSNLSCYMNVNRILLGMVKIGYEVPNIAQ